MRYGLGEDREERRENIFCLATFVLPKWSMMEQEPNEGRAHLTYVLMCVGTSFTQTTQAPT